MLKGQRAGVAVKAGGPEDLTLLDQLLARWLGVNDSVACSTITIEKPHEIGTIQFRYNTRYSVSACRAARNNEVCP